MDKQNSDQEWQQLQAHLEGFLGRAIRNDLQKIEYKPLFSVPLLEIQTELHQHEFREMNCEGNSE